ncbi:FecCD family ABC transporter permease [Nocardioides renjunii]|uniref:FecCD family ABC transporter permease n=1 Tax=Nocardioides renjunii TaxID=3095075 RepID=UPI002AFEED49|nr:iron chelate uptake ABC transporter family permease subunit [Nocardioides sp. S-34]WQQ21388.1 iron chelate uptake ABC transporter family permease subunit [Nocardioides sp. S-34]
MSAPQSTDQRPPGLADPAPAVLDRVRAGRRARRRRRATAIGVLAALVAAAYAGSLMLGPTVYPPSDVLAVVLGQEPPGAQFVVGRLRLPRASLAVLVGPAFGLAGATFQTLLRNPLASPDIIGVTEGASAAAAVAIVSFSLSGLLVSWLAVAAGIGVALTIYLLAYRRGVAAGTRFVLIGIGVALMMQSVISWQLERARNFELAEAMRWLTGSLNGALWRDNLLVLAALLVLGTAILLQARSLDASQLGDDTASALGVRVERLRLLAIVSAVGLVCFATAASGPIAFLAFLCGPIAARIVGPRGSLLVPAALVGALLTLVADFVGQHAFGTRMPVGVVTGILGAPYLIYLIVRVNRVGGTV